ncbi:MAG: YtxH domain-containing protein [Oscillochloris sp.]|nr:YtxH domain-containing protein [Oscillochloris sp.]
MSDIDQEIAALIPQERGGLLRGVLVGLLAGAAVAALRAPRDGAATREIVRERALEIKDIATELLRSWRAP